MRKFIISFIGGVLLATIIFFTNMTPANEGEAFRRLSDAFFIPAVLYLSIGLLSWMAQDGQFNGFRYALHRVATMFKWGYPRKMPMKYEGFISKEKTPKEFKYLILSGTSYLILALIFNILFNNA